MLYAKDMNLRQVKELVIETLGFTVEDVRKDGGDLRKLSTWQEFTKGLTYLDSNNGITMQRSYYDGHWVGTAYQTEKDEVDMINYSDIYEQTIADGGYTLDKGDGTGYVVGMSDNSFTCEVGDYDAFCKQLDKVLRLSNNVGTWRDGHTIYIDPVTLVKDRQKAIEMGKFYNQLAIYDLANEEVINL